MKNNIFINPYYCYIFSFGIALIIYSWGWSEIYPKLTISVVFFLLSTFVTSFFLGKNNSSNIQYKSISLSKNCNFILFFIFFGYILEFIYNKGVPLFFILKGADISYMEFGIPTFHVFLLTFSSFYTVYIYHQYISHSSFKLLLIFFSLLFPYVLIVNRAALIMVLIACLLLYLSSLRKIILKLFVLFFLGSAIFLYGFGYLGNARSFNNDPMAFLTLTKASDNFVESAIPKEYYWFYIYASSPFANFQNAVITSTNHRYDIAAFITWELLPDFISKRLVPQELDHDAVNRLDYSINPILTVGTTYYDPYIRFGWAGPVIIFLFYSLLVYAYIRILPSSSKYYLSGISILCVISIFNVFENMLNFSGLSVQLFYPILLHKLSRLKITGFNLPKVRIILRLTKFRIRI